MFMPKKDLTAIYEYLFMEGVMVAQKDFHAPKHPALKKIRNLHVIKAMQSLKSRGYVKEQFAWRHYYWYLTNSGIQYLRDYLHLPPEIVPPTLKRKVEAGGRPEYGRGGRGGETEPDQKEGQKPEREGQGYRRGPSGGFESSRPGGFGRGRPVQSAE